VAAAVAGQDAVLDAIGGPTPYKATTLETSVANAVIAAMRQHGVRRLVVISMLGEGDSLANAPFYTRLLLATLLRGDDKDKAAMESAVTGSDLDWVILRPAFLTDDPAQGNVRVFEVATGETAHQTTRADLATFMVAQLTSDEYRDPREQLNVGCTAPIPLRTRCGFYSTSPSRPGW
jgi:putative NADH-flavin reductase